MNIAVLKLFDVKWKYDPIISVKKMEAYYFTNERFTQTRLLVGSMMDAHKEILRNYIFRGCVFRKMEQNPLNSRDAQYGLPPLWNTILDEIIDEQECQERFIYERPMIEEDDTTPDMQNT